MTTLSCHRLRYCHPTPSQGTRAAVLTALEVSFAPGTLSLISGPTGSGKTTLLHLLAGLLRPESGEVRWRNEAISRWHSSHKDRWRRQVGIVFQQQHLLADLTAGENVLLPLIPRQMTLKAQAEAVENALARVDLTDKACSRVTQLSGGERQRLAIARAIAPQPAILLADEPSAFQDDAQAAGIITLLEAEKHRGAVVVACSHDPRLRDPTWTGVDRRYLLDQGRLEAAP